MNDSLLPVNASHFERNLSDVLTRVSEFPADFNKLVDANTCPAEFLPWLAWAFSVDEWRDDWSLTQKRQVIAHSFQVHQAKGTIGAMKLALQSLGYQLAVSEWFEYGGTPYTFRIDIGIGDEDISAATIARLQRVVEDVKNVRSQLDTVSINTRSKYSITSAAAHVSGHMIRLYSENTALDEEAIQQLELAIYSMGRIA